MQSIGTINYYLHNVQASQLIAIKLVILNLVQTSLPHQKKHSLLILNQDVSFVDSQTMGSMYLHLSSNPNSNTKAFSKSFRLNLFYILICNKHKSFLAYIIYSHTNYVQTQSLRESTQYFLNQPKIY